MTPRTRWLVQIAALATLSAQTSAQTADTLDFETGTAGWTIIGSGFEVEPDSADQRSGRLSIRTTRLGNAGFGGLSQSISVEDAAGGRVRLTGWIRTEGVDEGYAGLWARIDGVQQNLAFDNMSDRGARGATPWSQFDVELEIHDCARRLVFGVLHSGSGSAWYDDLVVSVTPPAPGRNAPDCSDVSQEFNLDFEWPEAPASGGPRGWLAEENFPGVALDTAVRYSGRQSLRLEGDSDTVITRTATQLPALRLAGRTAVVEGRVRGDGRLFVRLHMPDTTLEVSGETVDAGGNWATHRIEVPVERCASVAELGVEHRGAGAAWFDRLTLDIDSAGASAITLPEASESSLRDGPGLMSANQIALATDDCTPTEDPVWSTWVRENATPLRSLTSEDFSDLNVLADAIGDKRIVQLGESGHGVEHFNMAKTRLIKFLHEEMGFDVLAFESSLEECYYANKQRDDVPAADLMRNCIFGVWHTEEVIALFEYIQETSRTDRPLILAGFDTQTSSRTSSSRGARLAALIRPIDSAYAAEVEAMDGQALERVRRASQEPLGSGRDSLIALYEDLGRYLTEHADEMSAAPNVTVDDVRVAIQTTRSMIHYIRQLTGTGIARTMARDSGMADALHFVADTLYPDRKIITWGHNFHIRHRNQDVSPNPVKTMGAWVAEARRDELYTIGLYMYQGQAALNNREVYDIVRPSSGSLESIMHRAGVKYVFVDLAGAERTEGTEWMSTPVTAKTWGRSDVTMTLRDQYDAILFIDTVRPPTYR